MKICSNCGAESYRTESQFCLKCGTALPGKNTMPAQNICTNEECEYHKSQWIYPDDARFCDACGSPTVFSI